MGLFSDFLNPGKDDINKGYKKSRNMLRSAYNEAQPMMQQGYADARSYLEPYTQGGEAFDIQNRLAMGDQAAYDQYILNNPMVTGQIENALRGADRYSNARGTGAGMSGYGDLLRARLATEQVGNQWNRLAGLSQQGLQGSGMASQMAQAEGSDLSNFRYGYGQQQANLIMGKKMADMQSGQAGINNLIGLGGMGIKALGPGGFFGAKGMFG